VLVRKGFVIAGFLGGCTVLLGAYAQSLQAALFWNVFSLSFLGLATANNLALCRLTLIPARRGSGYRGAAGGHQPFGRFGQPVGLAAAVSGAMCCRCWRSSSSCLIGALTTLFLLQPRWAPDRTDPFSTLQTGKTSWPRLYSAWQCPTAGMLGQKPEDWLNNGERDRNNPNCGTGRPTYPELEALRGAPLSPS
jgi:hypothetical protein